MKSSLEEENLSNATAAANMNETTKMVHSVLDINATDIEVEAAKVPVKDQIAKSGTPILES